MTMVTGMRRADRKAQTRARLLDAAERVFAAKGYRGASVDDVADTAGLTKGAIYAHFRTKEALYLALVREREVSSIQEVGELFESERVPDRRTEALSSRLAAQLKDRDWLLLSYEFLAHAVRDGRLRREVRERLEAAHRVNVELIQRQWDDRGIRPAISADDFDRLMDGLGKHLVQQALLDPKGDLGPVTERLYGFLVRAASESASWED
jgi:AcrR family transcriptional regulator